ncbi:MAG: TIGR03663 family protein [Chloroflexota bacterium]|nr:TIGR03663 family protein [Chloroflexota bacterium]
MSEKKEIAFLDRPIIGDRIAWWKVIYALLILFVVFTRLWALAPRGYSHDESIHAWESWKLITGQGYSHDPTYHGPFLYHFTAFIFGLFGHNDYTARLSPALFGIALAVLPLLLKKWLGKKGVPAATFLIAISPVMMHRSRFLRHDVYVAVFNLLLFISSLRYLDQRKTKDLYLVAAATSLGFCAKETTFITYFIFGTFWALLFLSQWLRERTRPWRELPVFDLIIVMGTLILPLASPFLIRVLGGDPLDYTQQGILFSGAIFLVVLGISAAIGFWWDWRRWLVCAGIFYGIFVPLFTTMFTNGRGFATGTVGQLGYWLSQQGVRRGDQPPYYYLVLMPMYEFLPLLGAIGGGIYFFSKRSQDEEAVEDAPTGIPFVPMLLYWSVLAFVIYSWAGEKMPWLTMHLALPLQLLAGWAIGRLFDADWGELREKGALWLLLLIPLFIYVILRLLNLNPSAGTTRQELSETMAWLTSLLVGLGLVVAISRILYRLSGGQRWRIGLVSLFIILSMLTVRFAWMASFVNADLPTEFLVYAQGTPDVALVAKEIEEMSRRLTGGLHMKVAYDDDSSWPFVWYLRKFDNAQFYGQEPAGPFDAEVVLVGPPNESAVKPLLGNDYYRRQYRLIWWPNQDWYMSPELKSIRQGMKEKRIAGKLSDLLLYLKTMLKKIWRVVRDKSARQNLWDVFFYREYEASLTSWPHVHKFALYVRRDVAQQLWDYGPEVLTAAEPLPGDEYVEKWEQIMATDAFGSSGSGPGQLNRPKGIGVDEDGNVYVADTHNHRIQVFDGDGQFLRQWGAEGNQSGQFKEPWGVTVGPEGDIYIADTWNHRIQVFDVRGQLKRVWGTFGEVKDPMGSGDLLYGPRDLVVDAEGNLYVTDTGNKRVIKYDAEGNMIKAVGGAGSEEGQMQEPVGLALSPEGDLYVADTWNQRIQVFDKDLDFLRSWPVYAWEGMSVLNKPYLAVDAEGNVYATDPEGYRVLAFDSQGELLRVWGQKGGALSSMNLPTGVAVDPSGRLLISDSENGRLLVFEEH